MLSAIAGLHAGREGWGVRVALPLPQQGPWPPRALGRKGPVSRWGNSPQGLQHGELNYTDILGGGSYADTLEKENCLRSSPGAVFKSEVKLTFGILFSFLSSLPPTPLLVSSLPNTQTHVRAVMPIDHQTWKAGLGFQWWVIWPSCFCVWENLHPAPLPPGQPAHAAWLREVQAPWTLDLGRGQV